MNNELLVTKLLELLGEDPHREGLVHTPRRHITFLKQFTSPPELGFTTFAGEGYDEMIVQSNIQFYSLCEHHLIPFFGHGTIAYIPNKRIVGLSKLGRTLDFYARRLQNQERLTMQVADQIEQVLAPKGVAVLLTARHLCMEMRGIKKPGTVTTTSRMTGVFKSRPETRHEFLSLADFKNA